MNVALRTSLESHLRAVGVTGLPGDPAGQPIGYRQLLEASGLEGRLFANEVAAFHDLPRAVVDAMAGGAPVISTGVGGLADLLRHEGNALVVATDSAESIADAIERLAATDGLSMRLAAAGQAAVRPMMQHKWIEALHATVTGPDG